MPDRPLIVNATAIGHRVDGIAVYGVNLVKALWRAAVDRPLTVVLNEEARRFFPESEIPPGASIRWVSARMSPSRGTTGNMRRWLFANHLARQHRDALVFGLSQLEAPIVGGRGIVTVHDMIPWLFRSAHPRQYHFYRHYLGRALNHAHAVVTPSQATKDDVCRYYGIEECSRARHPSRQPGAGVDSARSLTSVATGTSSGSAGQTPRRICRRCSRRSGRSNGRWTCAWSLPARGHRSI